MSDIKNIYDLLPYIIFVGLMLNIIGNMIKITFQTPGKYIIWILLLISICINVIFFGMNFEAFFVGFLSFSFSISSYDLIKCFLKLKKSEIVK